MVGCSDGAARRFGRGGARAAASAGAAARLRPGVLGAPLRPVAAASLRPAAVLRRRRFGRCRSAARRRGRFRLRRRRGQVEPAARAEVRVARVQLAAARAGAADARLAQHGLAARGAELGLEPAQLRVEHAEVLRPSPSRARRRPARAGAPRRRGRRGRAARARGRGAGSARGGGPCRGGRRRRGARGPRGRRRRAGAARPRGRARGAVGAVGADPWAGSGSAVGSVRVSSAAPGRLMRRRRPLMLSGTRLASRRSEYRCPLRAFFQQRLPCRHHARGHPVGREALGGGAAVARAGPPPRGAGAAPPASARRPIPGTPSPRSRPARPGARPTGVPNAGTSQADASITARPMPSSWDGTITALAALIQYGTSSGGDAAEREQGDVARRLLRAVEALERPRRLVREQQVRAGGVEPEAGARLGARDRVEAREVDAHRAGSRPGGCAPRPARCG